MPFDLQKLQNKMLDYLQKADTYVESHADRTKTLATLNPYTSGSHLSFKPPQLIIVIILIF